MKQQITLQTWLLRWGGALRSSTGLPHSALSVLANLVSHSPREAYPSAETISAQTDLCRRSTFAALRALEETTWDGVPLVLSAWSGRRCPSRTFAGLELIRAEMSALGPRQQMGWLSDNRGRFERRPRVQIHSTESGPEDARICTPGVQQLLHPRNQQEPILGSSLSASDRRPPSSFLSLQDSAPEATAASPRSPLADVRDGVEYARASVVQAGERPSPAVRASGRVYPWERR